MVTVFLSLSTTRPLTSSLFSCEGSCVPSARKMPITKTMYQRFMRCPISRRAGSDYVVCQAFLANGVCRVLVGCHVADHGVGEHQEFACDGDDGDAGGLSARLEGGVEG